MDLFTIGMKADTSQLRRGKGDLDNFAKGAKGVDNQARNMTRSIMGATTAIAAFLATSRSITTITSFEDAMLGLNAVTRATTKDMAAMEKQARSLGATSVFSATEAANAQRFLAQAGFDVNEVLTATPTALRLAQAGSLDLAAAADIASNVLGGMRLEVDQFNRVADVMAETAAASNTNIEQLGQALSFAAPVAAGAGVSIELASAAIGKLSDAGLQSTRAGTGLLGVIRQLSAPSKEATGILASYGLTLKDVSIQSNGLQTVLERTAKAGFSTADMFKIFGSEAQPAAAILMDNVAALDQLNTQLGKADGAAEAMAKIMSSGLSAAFKGFNSQVGESILQLGGSGLTASLQSVTEGATGLLAVYNGMDAAFAETNNLTKEQHENLIDLADSIKTTTMLVSGAVGGWAAYTLAVNGATAATKLFTIATKANPLGLLLVGAGALTGYMLTLSDETETAAESVDRLTSSSRALNNEQKELLKTSIEQETLLQQKRLDSYNEQIAQIKSLRAMETDIQKAGRSADGNDDPLIALGNRAAASSSRIDELNSKLKDLNTLVINISSGQNEIDSTTQIEKEIDLNQALMYEYQIYQDARIEGDKEYQSSLADTIATYATVKTELEQLKEAQDKLQYASITANPDQMAGIQDALDNVNAQIANLDDPFKSWSASLADAASGMSQFTDATDESGKSTAKLQVAMAALNAVQAINGVINQSGGDPYTAFGRMAAMAASMAALGQSIGGLGGSNSDTSAEAQKTQGTGSVLGFFDAKSESIANSLDLIETINDSLLGVNQSMLNELKNLNNAITGASNQVARNVSFEGIGQLGNFSKNPLEDFNPLSIFGDFLDFGGMLGGSSDVSNEGISIVGGTIADIVNNTTALAFQEVKTKKYAWSSSRTRTYTQAVASSVEAQFDNLYTSIVDTVAAGASAIGIDDGTISNVLSNFVFDSIDISLKGLDADGKTAALEAVFSKAFDNLASSMLPFLSEFQNAGEGFGETLSRISTELAVAQKAADRLGQSINQGVVGNIRLADIMSEVSGGAESLANNISGFTDNFYSSSEQAAFLLSDLNGVLSELGVSLPMTEKGFRDLVEAQNINTIAGAENIATLLDLQDEASEYYNLLEESTAVFDSITDFVRDLMGLAADGTTTLSSAKSAYESALSAAIGGDKDAIADLSSLAQTYLNLTSDSVSTGAELRAAQQAVIGQLTGLTGTVPAYANGTDYHAGGWAMVGEQGPELVNLPTGSSVKTNSETNSMMNQAAVVDAINRLISLTNGGFSVLAKNSKVMAEYMEVWDNEGLLINSTTPIRVETV
jgi:TP901 family phage tail tape measure protein